MRLPAHAGRIAGGALCLAVLVDASGPAGVAGFTAIWVVLGCAIWAISWLVRAARWAILSGKSEAVRASGVWLAVEAIWAIQMAVALGCEIPFRSRFRLSEPALTRYAAAVAAGSEKPDRHPRRVGFFPVSQVRRDAGEVYLCIQSEFFGDYGLVYAPTRAPQPDGWRPLEPLGRGWYRRSEPD